jgi:hypothetical protein
MNGAAPVLTRTINGPTNSSTTTIGVSHHALLSIRRSTRSRSRPGNDSSDCLANASPWAVGAPAGGAGFEDRGSILVAHRELPVSRMRDGDDRGVPGLTGRPA